VFNKKYGKQVEIILKVIPLIFKQKIFAIKGGTALNLFYFHLPRLSVDIDLVYLPIENRELSFKRINLGLDVLRKNIERLNPDYRVEKIKKKNDNIFKLLILSSYGNVKIEVNEVIRGSIENPVELYANNKVEEIFGRKPIARVLTIEEVLAGKICAALSRQHPRDFFDVGIMFSRSLFNDKTKKYFLVYLIQSNKPIHEILSPREKDITELYNKEFLGMVREDIKIENLFTIRKWLFETILKSLNADDKEFLISFKSGSPAWDKLGLVGIDELPAVKWKLYNLSKMDVKKKREFIKKLEVLLFKY